MSKQDKSRILEIKNRTQWLSFVHPAAADGVKMVTCSH